MMSHRNRRRHSPFGLCRRRYRAAVLDFSLDLWRPLQVGQDPALLVPAGLTIRWRNLRNAQAVPAGTRAMESKEFKEMARDISREYADAPPENARDSLSLRPDVASGVAPSRPIAGEAFALKRRDGHHSRRDELD